MMPPLIYEEERDIYKYFILKLNLGLQKKIIPPNQNGYSIFFDDDEDDEGNEMILFDFTELIIIYNFVSI